MLCGYNNIFLHKFKVAIAKSLFLLWCGRKKVFMSFTKIKLDKRIKKITELLKISGKSQKTIENYSHAINRFLDFYKDEDISKLDESAILKYMKKKYLNKNCSANTYNLNVAAIKFFYSVSFKKDFNKNLLPHSKLKKELPKTIEKDIFLKILNSENNIEHKCWLLLAYCSGLRVEEIATVKVKDIHSPNHELIVLGKGNKERITLLPDITIKFLRLYYRKTYLKNGKRGRTPTYLFKGSKGTKHTNSKTIINYFTSIKSKHKLNKNVTFHSLRHSFATNFLKAGGDTFVLKSMMGHSSLNTTSIYVHTGRDFNNLKGVKYERI